MMTEIIHVYPLVDDLPHNTSGTDCWCKPALEEVRDGVIVIHNKLEEVA